MVEDAGTGTVRGAVALDTVVSYQLQALGPSVEVANDAPGGSTQEIFGSSPSQGLLLRTSDVVVNGGTGTPTFYVRQPSGSSLSSAQPLTNGISLIPNLVESGTHAVVIDAAPGTRVNAKLQLELATSASASLDGPPTNFVSSSFNPTQRLTVNLSSGDEVSFGMAGLSPAPSSIDPWRMDLYAPDGSLVSSQLVTAAADAVLEPQLVPATGTYQLLIYRQSGTVTGDLYVSTPAGVGWDTSVTNELATRPGQNLRLPFVVDTNAIQYGLGFKNLSIVGASSITARVLLNGNELLSLPLSNANDLGRNLNFPSAGNAELLIDPPGTRRSPPTWESTPDPGRVGDVAFAAGASTSIPGQNLRLRFDLDVNNKDATYALYATTITGSSNPAAVQLLDVNGNSLASHSLASGGRVIAQVRNQTDPVTLFIDPPEAATISLSSAITLPASSVWSAPNQSALALTTNTPAQQARLRFDGVAGAIYQLCLNGVAFSGDSGAGSIAVVSTSSYTSLYTGSFNAGTTPVSTCPPFPRRRITRCTSVRPALQR
ncbi:MAG: hypothetical protein HC933_21975 [Pleurocapsa sp. SU_196_0]|nr:hypothetical protein [Pleurocapsa sp. SU_196_0]